MIQPMAAKKYDPYAKLIDAQHRANLREGYKLIQSTLDLLRVKLTKRSRAELARAFGYRIL